MTRPPARTLARAEWEPLAAAHRDRADALTAAHRERTARGEKHPVEDFLYEYYSTRPSLLRRWHPGARVALEGAGEHAGWRWYRTDAGATRVDLEAFLADRGDTVRFVLGLLDATAGRAPRLGCFGLHEWAMVYRQDAAERRHALPLRLGGAGTDAVVEGHEIQCTHFDAFRFFTPDAVPLNREPLTRAGQVASEQPGCLHVTMDLYKWASKLSPAVSSEIQLDAFALAADVRRVDMRASPYDVSSYGLDPVRIETPEGKREYAALQRDFADRGADVRERLAASCRGLVGDDGALPAAEGAAASAR